MVADSTQADSVAVDLADIPGYIVYDKELDGVFDDTAVFSGSEDGLFGGILQYNIPVNITATRLKKHVHLILPALEVDTFLAVAIYGSDSDVPGGANEWPPIVVRPDK